MVEVDALAWSEIESALKSMTGRKSPGPNEVSLAMIKAAGPMGMQWLGRVLKYV